MNATIAIMTRNGVWFAHVNETNETFHDKNVYLFIDRGSGSELYSIKYLHLQYTGEIYMNFI